MINKLPYDMVIYLENYSKINDILNLRLVCKDLNIHDKQYYKNLFIKEKSLDIIKIFLLNYISNYKVKKKFIHRILNEVNFRKKYFIVHKFPLHVCTHDHRLSKYLKRFFKSVPEVRNKIVRKIKNKEIVQLLNNTELTNYDIVSNSFNEFVNVFLHCLIFCFPVT